MSSTKSYFDKHSHHHPYVKDPTFYQLIINNIERIKVNDQISILDRGCGNGSFIKGLIMMGINGVFIGTDVSDNMIKKAHENLAEYERVHLFVADGFDLPIHTETKFDLIHLDSVLHHLIGKTRGQSISFANKMLKPLTERLTENGVLVIDEMYYISHIIPHFTSYLIFHGLKLLNSLHLDISKFRGEFQPGLEVNFFSQEQIEKLLQQYGSVKMIRRHSWKQIPLLYRFFLLKDAGHVSYMVKPY
jgi:SAM-dependent methyltransferase